MLWQDTRNVETWSLPQSSSSIELSCVMSASTEFPVLLCFFGVGLIIFPVRLLVCIYGGGLFSSSETLFVFLLSRVLLDFWEGLSLPA